jgi:uncharacterized protein
MSRMVRAVLDTNIVLSSLVFPSGLAGRVRVAWQRGRVVPLVSRATVQELVRVLAYPKFHLSSSDQKELLADYLPYVETVQMPAPLPAVPECRDAMDLPFMQLAVAGRAQVLVSGDRDLHAVATTFESMCACPIVTLNVFCKAWLPRES